MACESKVRRSSEPSLKHTRGCEVDAHAAAGRTMRTMSTHRQRSSVIFATNSRRFCSRAARRALALENNRSLRCAALSNVSSSSWLYMSSSADSNSASLWEAPEAGAARNTVRHAVYTHLGNALHARARRRRHRCVPCPAPVQVLRHVLLDARHLLLRHTRVDLALCAVLELGDIHDTMRVTHYVLRSLPALLFGSTSQDHTTHGGDGLAAVRRLNSHRLESRWPQACAGGTARVLSYVGTTAQGRRKLPSLTR